MLQSLKTILAVIITTIVVGSGVYWYTSTQQNELSIEQQETLTETVVEKETQKDSESDTSQEVAEEETKMFFVSCMDSLYSYNQHEIWRARFSELYPDLTVYDAGAYCELNNGNQLISFSHFLKAEGGGRGGQTIILFDQNNNVLKATEDFLCITIGDLGYPVFESIENNIVTMSCSSWGGPNSIRSTYELDLDTFEFRLTGEDNTFPAQN